MIEIMVVIALMGALAAVLAVGASRLLLERTESADDIFWQAIGEARKYALIHETDVTLSFDIENQAFLAATDLGSRSYPLPEGPAVKLDFLGVTEGEQTVLIGGALVEANLLPAIKFFSDGTCMPFRARLEVAGKPPLVIEIDPWTCAPLLRSQGTGIL